MNVTDQLPRLAMDAMAQMYVQDHIDQALLFQQFNAWCRKQYFKQDDCDIAEAVTVSITARGWLEVPGYANPQYGHLFTMTFEEASVPPEEYKKSQLFLRTSETGKIVELCQFQPTLH